MLLHPDPVAENRPAAEGAARVDRHDPHGTPASPVARDQAADQGALAGPGRTGDAEDRRASGSREEVGQDRLPLGRPFLDQRDGPRQGGGVPLRHAAGQLLHQTGCPGAPPRR